MDNPQGNILPQMNPNENGSPLITITINDLDVIEEQPDGGKTFVKLRGTRAEIQEMRMKVASHDVLRIHGEEEVTKDSLFERLKKINCTGVLGTLAVIGLGILGYSGHNVVKKVGGKAEMTLDSIKKLADGGKVEMTLDSIKKLADSGKNLVDDSGKTFLDNISRNTDKAVDGWIQQGCPIYFTKQVKIL